VSNFNDVALLGPVCALMSSVTWAFGSTRYSELSAKYGPFAVNFSRALIALPLFIFAAIIMNGFGGALSGYSALQTRQVLLLSLAMVGSYGFGDALFLWSTSSLGVPGALAIASTYPFWTTLVGAAYKPEGLSARQFAGMCITVVGVVAVVLSARRVSRGATIGRPRTGFLLALAASFMWAMHSFIVSYVGPGLSPPVVNTVRMSASLVITSLMSAVLFRKKPVVLPPRSLVSSLWLFAYEAFGGSYFYVYGLSHSSVVVGVTLTALAPVLAVPIAWFLGTEKPNFRRTAGVAAVFVGLWLLVL
jgi:drug/metabolite transporter (DMT)-like permease